MPDPRPIPPSRADIETAAGRRSFERGLDYFETERVASLEPAGDGVRAIVVGQSAYEVTVSRRDDGLRGDCTCPVGSDAAFCKHCVAAALAWIDGAWGVSESRRDGHAGIEAYVRALPHERLVKYVLTLAIEDDRVRKDLECRAEAAATAESAAQPDVKRQKRALSRAIRPNGFVDYHEAHEYTRGVERAIDSIDTVLAAGAAGAAVELAEHALTLCEEAIGSMDDSSGEMGSILRRLEALHHSACVAARPDPAALARRLHDWRLRTGYDVFHHFPLQYADVLGPAGLAVAESLLREAWERLPALRPGADSRERWGERYKLQSGMEEFATLSGDTDRLVAVMQKDLSVPYNFTRIADVLRRAGRTADAIAWCERCRTELENERHDPRLIELLAALYAESGRAEDGLGLLWRAFDEKPGAAEYGRFREHATAAKAWPAWRDRAIARLERQVRERCRKDGSPRAGERHWDASSARDTLVRALLGEGRRDAAWRVAHEGECGEGIWTELAASRESDDPAGAIEAWGRVLAPLLAHASPSTYLRAAQLVARVRGLHARASGADAAAQYVAGVREACKRRSRFLKELDAALRR
ncbi:MAG: hypothetical protein HMLKMBBP_01413 [Planctomycetes bacterium]|nr:hypothetical protein [Planctomycetota bacterium]